MRITSVNFPLQHEYGDRLKAIRMDKLNQVVVIAGRNGSGKSRLLNRISRANKERKEHLRARADAKDRLQQLDDLRRHKKLNEQEETLYKNYTSLFLKSYSLLYSKGNEEAGLFSFVPRGLMLQDPSELSKTTRIQFARDVATKGVANLMQGTLSAIQYTQDKWFEATHQASTIGESQKQQAIDDYERLKFLIYQFLNTAPDRNGDGDATLFGFPLGKAHFSDGQKVLLQLAIALFAQASQLSNLILLLDEPENHLHPSVMLEFIGTLQRCVGDGQLWIATHSVPLLAHLHSDPNSSLFWMEDGQIEYAGSIPQKVLEGLLGNSDRISRTADFLNYPAQLATNRFASQCLASPNVVEFDKDDPQLRQIKEALLGVSGDSVRILDFGAGKGRLASALFDAEELDRNKLRERLDYVAFDTDTKNRDECENAIGRIYGSADKRYFHDYGQLLTDSDKCSFDVVIMCNVLHEIEPSEWLELFKPGGAVTELLKPNGFLLLVEDMEMPIGEKAHQKGFLVLDTPEVKELFGITKEDTGFNFSSLRDGRLKAHKIPKPVLERITHESRHKAIVSVYETAKRKIKELRNSEGSYQNGRKHGFWVQQLANAELTLSGWGRNRS